MKCKEFMTENPVFCVSADSVASVAQLMKDLDIGAVPVVTNPDERILIGLVTDRDVAVRVDAAGVDADLTLVGEVMTGDIATCVPEDECRMVLEIMAARQVRRVPIVDANGRLFGIIAQADVARCVENTEEVAGLLKEISRPIGGIPGETPHRQLRLMKYCRPTLLTVGGVGLGAATMYLLDPSCGRGRRRKLLDRAHSVYARSGEKVAQIGQDVANRATGLAAEAKSVWLDEPVSDEKLLGRVRAKLGRVTKHPHAIEVTAHEGRVNLRGPILAREADSVLQAVKRIPGVARVESHLEKHESASGVPGLEGHAPSKKQPFRWAPWLRIAGIIALGLLTRVPAKAPVAAGGSAEPRRKPQAA